MMLTQLSICQIAVSLIRTKDAMIMISVKILSTLMEITIWREK